MQQQQHTTQMQYAHHSHTHAMHTITFRKHARSTPRKHDNTTNASGRKTKALTDCHPDQRASHASKSTVSIQTHDHVHVQQQHQHNTQMQYAHHSHTHHARGTNANTHQKHARSKPRKHNNTKTQTSVERKREHLRTAIPTSERRMRASAQ